MSGLPQVTGQRLVRALLKYGFIESRQKGSHVLLVHKEQKERRATVPIHGNRDLKPGTLHAILKGAGVSSEELRDWL